MIEPELIKKLTDAIFHNKNCFSKIDYPEAYCFFLDLEHLSERINACEEVRIKKSLVLPPSSHAEKERQEIIVGFDLFNHKQDTIKHIISLANDLNIKNKPPLLRLSEERCSLKLEELYRDILYGCITHVKEHYERVDNRERKLSVKLVCKVLKENDLADYYVIVKNTQADCELRITREEVISNVKLSLENWGRDLNIRVTFNGCEAVPLSELFGVSGNIYVHDEDEKEIMVLTVLKLVKCINQYLQEKRGHPKPTPI